MSFYPLLFLFVSVLVFSLLQLAKAQHSKYLLDFTCVIVMILNFYLKTQLNNSFWTHFVHLIINLILSLKWVPENGIENILVHGFFNSA